MKKLMFAAAVMAAGAAMAVESQIVGYQTTAANKKGVKTAVGVMFAQVGSEDYDIQQIVCKDGDQDPESLFRLWWWDPVNGYQYANYQNYEAYADDGEEGGDGTCYDDKFYWCDDDGWILVPTGWKHDADAPATIVDHGKVFEVGEGFFLEANSNIEDPKVTVAGQVLQPATDKEFVTLDCNKKGVKTMVVNPFGAAFDIQEFRCFDGDQDPESLFRLWWWDPVNGYQYANYQNYEAYADDGEEGGDGTCYDDKFYWCDDDGWILVPTGWKHDADAPATIVDHGKAFAAGEGFFVEANSNIVDPKAAFRNPFYTGK